MSAVGPCSGSAKSQAHVLTTLSPAGWVTLPCSRRRAGGSAKGLSESPVSSRERD